MEQANTNETRKYTVITSAGYWGKGNTPTEAAKNANVTSKIVNGTLYRTHKFIEGEINCDGLGGTNFNYTSEWQHEWFDSVRPVLRDATKLASGKMKITKGKLNVTSEFE